MLGLSLYHIDELKGANWEVTEGKEQIWAVSDCIVEFQIVLVVFSDGTSAEPMDAASINPRRI